MEKKKRLLREYVKLRAFFLTPQHPSKMHAKIRQKCPIKEYFVCLKAHCSLLKNAKSNLNMTDVFIKFV